MVEEKSPVSWRSIPSLNVSNCALSETLDFEPLWKHTRLSFDVGEVRRHRGCGNCCNFACISLKVKREQKHFVSSPAQLMEHPLAIISLVPKDVALFLAGAGAGALAKTVTAPLDRIKILMQTHGVRVGQESTKKAIGFIDVIKMITKEEGMKGYWKGNLPQVIRIIPYSAVQLFSYEIYKKLFKGKDGELSLVGRLAAGACAGMTSTFITYPLDVHTLLLKKSLPEKFQTRTEASLFTALASASIATLTCYPLDTVRRQMQMRGTPYKTVLDAIPGIIARDGFLGLYRGFLPNALKNLPNSSIRLTTFDIVKRLIAISEKELQRIMEENGDKKHQSCSG